MFATLERQFPPQLRKSALLRSVWGFRRWACMCAVNYSCAWSRWMYLSAFYLQRKGVLRQRVAMCDEMKCVRALRGAVALSDAGLLKVQSSWGGTDRAQSVWWGKQFKHLQKMYFTGFNIAPFDTRTQGLISKFWIFGHRNQHKVRQLTTSTVMILGDIWLYGCFSC